MATPTIKTLQTRLGLDVSTAKAIRGLMTGDSDPRQYASVQGWLDQCFNEPSGDEMIMCAIDELLGTYGVEPIRGRYVDSYHQDIQAVYCNAGDTYDGTILLDHETGRYIVTSWGDWFEARERSRELI